MTTILRFEFLRLTKSKGLYASLSIGIVLSIWLTMLSVQMHNESMDLLAKAGPEDAAYFFPSSVFTNFIGIDYSQLPTAILFGVFPILVILPFSASFYQDVQSGYVKHVFTRIDKKKYFIAKYITVFFAGFITVMSILVLNFLMVAMFIPAIKPEITAFTFPVCDSNFLWSEIYRETPYIYLLMYSLIDAAFLGIWATVPLTISHFAKHKFSALAGSAVLYYLINYVFLEMHLLSFMPENFLRQYQPIRVDIEVIIIEIILILFINFGVFVGIGAHKDVY